MKSNRASKTRAINCLFGTLTVENTTSSDSESENSDQENRIDTRNEIHNSTNASSSESSNDSDNEFNIANMSSTHKCNSPINDGYYVSKDSERWNKVGSIRGNKYFATSTRPYIIRHQSYCRRH